MKETKRSRRMPKLCVVAMPGLSSVAFEEICKSFVKSAMSFGAYLREAAV